MPVPGTRTVRRTLPSAPRLMRTGPAPTLVEMPRWLTVSRNGPTFLLLRYWTIACRPLLERTCGPSKHRRRIVEAGIGEVWRTHRDTSSNHLCTNETAAADSCPRHPYLVARTQRESAKTAGQTGWPRPYAVAFAQSTHRVRLWLHAPQRDTIPAVETRRRSGPPVPTGKPLRLTGNLAARRTNRVRASPDQIPARQHRVSLTG